MYSVVLLMALSGGAETPALGHRGGCDGCSGYSGCNGGGCHGCDHGCHGGRGRRHGERRCSLGRQDNAKQLIDDADTASTTALRTIESPDLETGKDHYYTLKAEVVREGKAVAATKRIAVRAGEETRVSLELPVTSVAQQ